MPGRPRGEAAPSHVRDIALIVRGVSWTWLTAEEISALLTATHRPARTPKGKLKKLPERHRLCWTVAIYTGLRRGEFRALQWRDVHLEGDHPRLVVRRPKSNKSREVPLLRPAAAALKRWRELSPEIGTAHVWRPMRRRPGEPRAGRIHRDWDLGWRDWGPAIVGRSVRPHDLRHTCARTWCRAPGDAR